MQNTKQTPYNPEDIEPKWQQIWTEKNTYSPDLDKAKNPYYNLMMFPYPSAEGLHVGNMYAFTGADVHGRFIRMQGFQVFEPIGLDGFGIHSENYALKVGTHPYDQAKKAQKNFYRQFKITGNGYDWNRSLDTYDPSYYRWTQWLFIEMFKHGLAYRKKAQVNWCPSCKTVLSDEQVIAGECERCGSLVERRNLEQWFFRITNYAQQLLDNLDKLDWSERVKTAQRNWIGRSEGALITFAVVGIDRQIKAFTTRPDTLHGATFMVVSPEHEIVTALLNSEFGVQNSELSKVKEYTDQAKKKTEQERTAEGKEKTGVFSGLYVTNPVTHKKIPIWVADYVLMGYGTGAIMAVPAHDQRDFEFAKKFDLPIVPVIRSDRENVVIVHGCPKRESDLKDVSQDSADKFWINWLQQTLREQGETVFVPQMPTPWDPDFMAWRTTLEKLPIGGQTTLIGHSCGAAFLVRWLAQTDQHIKKLILVAPAKILGNKYDSPKREKIMREFFDFEISPGVKDKVEEIVIVTGAQDKERQKESAKIYAEALDARVVEIKDTGHFVEELYEFPEFYDEIATLSQAYKGGGKLLNSGEWNGWMVPQEIGKTVGWSEKKKIGQKEVNYHLRDWLISRQRYWGPPIPMIYCEKCAEDGRSWFSVRHHSVDSVMMGRGGVGANSRDDSWAAGWFPVPDDQLPVMLPYIQDFKPLGTGKAPLANHPEFYETVCPECGGQAVRETDVSDTFLDSAWYFLRYTSTDKEMIGFDSERTSKWLPVDIYIGGAEHAVLHLLYARFVTMVLRDFGYIDFDEPFTRFFAHGLIIKEGAKMSKSKGNVIVPDEYVGKYGADTLRMYLMFLGPFSQGGDFRDTGIEGMYRFVRRVWHLFHTMKFIGTDDNKVLAALHKTIKAVTDDMRELSYNTAIARLMEFYNLVSSEKGMTREMAECYLKLFAPLAPHFTEEVYHTVFGHSENESIHFSDWPVYDEKYLISDQVIVAIQVNGKRRGELVLTRNEVGNEEFVKLKAQEKVGRYLEGQHIMKAIYIPHKIINFVVKPK